MIAKPLEIEVALLDYVSVGKTTVLNALFQDKYAGENGKAFSLPSINILHSESSFHPFLLQRCP